MLQLSPGVVVHDVDEGPGARDARTLYLPTRRGAAFGDGTHPTTRLCARAVDACCRWYAPRALLDVGTGTGVLARLARSRGVPLVVGTDVDDEILQVAARNAALDAAPSAPIRFERASPDARGPVFDVVVANILEEVLLSLSSALAAALAPGGRLLLSGVTTLQAPRLRVRCESLGLLVDDTVHLEGWALVQARRAGASA
jgi:ribosomal protein L11 methyltransferase